MNKRPDKVEEIMIDIKKNFVLSADAQRLLKTALRSHFSRATTYTSALIGEMLDVLGLTRWEINCILSGHVPSAARLRYPVTVAVKRYYRIYVDAPEDATNAEILKTAHNMVIEDTSVLEGAEDPEMTIEDDDVETLEVDNAGAWEVKDDE